MKLFIVLAASLLIPTRTHALEDPRYELPKAGETYLNSFNAYAKKILKPDSPAETSVRDILLPKLTLDWSLPEEAYDTVFQSMQKAMYQIEVPKDKECNPWTEDQSKAAAYRDTIVKQIDDAVAFLADYHARMLARNNSLFKIRRIVICANSRHYTTSMLSLDRFKAELTLKIGPKRLALIEPSSPRRDNLHPLSAKEIKAQWEDGEHWRKDISITEVIDANKNPIRAYWRMINPIGETRVLLREGLVKAALVGASIIRALKEEGSPLEWKAHLFNTLGDGLKAETQKRIEALSEPDLKSVLSTWEKKLISPESEGAMTIATFSSVLQKRMEKQRKTRIDRKQRGFINIENFHNIDVSFATGDAKDFQESIVVPETIDVNVDQAGFINISTTDVVDVNVALAALGSASGSVFNKATLKSALKSLRLE